MISDVRNGNFPFLLVSSEIMSSFCQVSSSNTIENLKGFFHPACLARVVSLFASVPAIFMVHENGDEQRQAKI